MEILKVSKSSTPNSVARAISAVIREKGEVEIQTIGAAACNQAVKAIAISKGYLAPMGLDLVCSPSFTKIDIDGEDKTAIKIVVFPK